MDRLEGKVLNRVRALRAEQTPAEKTLWSLLRAKRFMGTKWRRQAPWKGCVIDFYCAKLEIALEVDGPVHEDGDRARRDYFKRLSLERAGIVVLRVTNAQVTQELAGVSRLIRDAVETRMRREPLPTP